MKKPRKHRPRRLLYENLEAREVMTAGLTATLSGSGVLTVSGTSGADEINFRQNDGLITIEDVSKIFKASKVKSIVVDLGAGNDVVSLDSLTNGGNQALAEKVIIQSGPGNETVHLGGGRDVNFSGAGNTLVIGPTGDASLNGIGLNFEDTIQMSLNNGVLTVTGTNSANTIKFLQSDGWLGIQGGTQWFAASNVNSIVVNLQSGDDYVSFDSIISGCNQEITAALTVHSGLGNETVRLPNGTEVSFSGLGNTLTVSSSGVAKLNGLDLDAEESVQMSFDNGVLTVTDTSAADTIKFIQHNGWMGIAGGTKWFAASTVNSIVVNLQGGDDFVSFDSIKNGCNQAITAALTVYSGGGNEKVRLQDGTEVSFSGVGNTLTVTSDGVAKLNGAPIVSTESVEMSFNNGVLTVTDTSSADTIKFIQHNGWMGIAGGTQWYSASTVTAIVVNLQDGNDYVSFDSIKNGCNQEITAALTVNSGAGNETVRLQDGTEVSFSGPGNILTVSSSGVAKLNGVALAPEETVVMSFANGVLTITAKSGDDILKLLQGNGWIGIQGGTQWFAASTVTSIIINLQGGNDYLSLDSLFNGCNQEIAAAITVNSGAGSKEVRCPNGNTANFSGSHQLKVETSGAVKLDGVELWPAPNPPAQNWFDTNVQDAALRSLGHSLYTDNLIDRADIIALLQNAEDGGVIDATELNDLRAIAAASTLFGSAAHLQSLTGYVVNSTTANAKYQGQTLGNLAAGSTTAHMEKLVNKWFFGLDRPTASGTYRQMAGSLFVNGASYSDIRQGNVGDCYFVMSLAEVADNNPSIITNMFTANGDGTYTVKFFNFGTPYYVTVDSYLPTNGSGQLIYAGVGSSYTNSSNELWVSLAEKAYVQLNEFGFVRPGLPGNGQNAYSAISGGYVYAALGHVSGQATTAFTMTSGSSSFTTFVNAYNAGKMIGFASYASTPAGSGVVASHAYAVVGYDASAQTLTLFNPWGTQYGLLTLTWSQVQASFQYFDRTA